MKKEADFLIKHYKSYDGLGKIDYEYYYIQERKKFLWWSYFKDIGHEECGYGYCYIVRAKFKTLEEAQSFVRDILCPQIPRNSSTVTIVDTLVCKN